MQFEPVKMFPTRFIFSFQMPKPENQHKQTEPKTHIFAENAVFGKSASLFRREANKWLESISGPFLLDYHFTINQVHCPFLHLNFIGKMPVLFSVSIGTQETIAYACFIPDQIELLSLFLCGKRIPTLTMNRLF